MMEAVFEWVCDIAVYLILVTIILQVIPKRFKKYLSFFTGILLIILVINPLTRLFDIDGALAGYFELGEMRQQLNDMENRLRLTENVGEEKLLEGYNEQIKENISKLIKEYGYKIVDIDVVWNLESESEEYGSIISIGMRLKEKRTEGTITVEPVKITLGTTTEEAYTREEIKEMKKLVANFYNLEEAHINIMIQG